MTAVVGVVHEGRVFLGADSAGVDGMLGLMTRADQKLIRRGEYLIGFTTSYRMGQLLRYHFDAPEPYGWEHDLLAFMSTRFIDAARECFKNHGWLGWQDQGLNRHVGGEFLVGFRGVLYHIEADFQVGLSSHGFDACGSGAQVALGAMHVTEKWSGALDPEARIRFALEAAEAFNAGVRSPFSIEATP